MAVHLLIIVLYLVLGTFLTPSEIILVTVPVLLPVAQAVGVHPIHFGMVCVIASAVGHITPPVGLCLFVGMAISGLPMDKLVRPAAAVPGRDRRACCWSPSSQNWQLLCRASSGSCGSPPAIARTPVTRAADCPALIG